VCEAARDGVSYAEAVARGYAALGEEHVLEGVADLLPRVEVEAAFADGSRLVVLEDPVRRDGPPELRDEPPVAWLDDARAIELELVNEGTVPVGITSHFHLFEVNRDVRLDRAAAWGMRLAVAPGTKVFVLPGEARTARAVPFAGARVIRGHAGLADGPLDAPGAREAALREARRLGYRGA
jgi:urease subunit gamma/beta